MVISDTSGWAIWFQVLYRTVVSQSVVLKPAASASPGNSPYIYSWAPPLLYWIRNCGDGPSNLSFNKITRWFCCTLTFENHWYKSKNLWLVKEEKETSLHWVPIIIQSFVYLISVNINKFPGREVLGIIISLFYCGKIYIYISISISIHTCVTNFALLTHVKWTV